MTAPDLAPPSVIVRSPGHTPLRLVVDGPLEIGRECAGLLLDDPMISRRHLELRLDGGVVVVIDLGSTNGTTVDGRRLSAPHALEPGQVVAFGGSSLTVATGNGERGAGADLRATSIDVVADSFAAERPDISEVARSHGTTTIVFSDIESSTELAEQLGDRSWFELLSVHNEIVRRRVAAHGGTEIKSQGDGFMLSFASARAAVRCMIEVQRDLAQRNEEHPERAVRIRAGCHTGEAIVDGDGDLFGKHVILAARIANEARGGEIVVSSLVRQIVEAHGDLEFGDERAVTLKGLTGTHAIFPVEWGTGS